MESNISSDNNNPQKQKPVPESLYTCTNCHYIPKLYFENNKVTIQCKCCRDCFKIFSIEEFLQKTKEPILGKCIRHPNNKGAGFCKECNSSYCEECLADHKTYPILKEHVIYSNLMQIPNMCQNEKCENKATHYCRECMKYLCEKCIKSGHKAHLNKNLDSKLNQSIFKKCKDNLKEAKSLNEKMKKFKEKLLNKINDSYNKYEKTFKAYCDFMDYVCGVFESVGKDTLDFNVVNNLEATIPNLDGRKKIDCNNINEVSIKAFFDTCDYVNRVKDLCVFENGNKYDGEMVCNKKDGFGKQFWPDGGIYVGDFHFDSIEGFGRYTFPEGSRYEGGWKNEKFEGFGVMYDKRGNIKYEGEWKNCKRAEIKYIPDTVAFPTFLTTIQSGLVKAK